MKLLKNILVTIDFSESSKYVIENSIRLAEKFHSQITLMHVIADEKISSEILKMYTESVKLKLENISSTIKSKGIEVNKIIIEKGVPFEKIILEAQNNEYNVIIAGSGNKEKQEAYKLGTTVEKIVRKNQIPVWVVKNEDLKEIHKIICPVDFSDASKRALNNAITLAHKFGAELLIMNVFIPVNYSSMRFEVDNASENKELKKKQEKNLNEFLEQFDFSHIKYRIEIKEGEPFLEILKGIMKNKIELLVMGTTGKTGLSRLLMGSVTEKVIREVPCNFITTKSVDITDNYFDSNLKSIESILSSARKSFEKKDFEHALEKYHIALKQYPDNIPVILGIIETYEAIENKTKAEYYKVYGREVVKRIWGDKYLVYFNLE